MFVTEMNQAAEPSIYEAYTAGEKEVLLKVGIVIPKKRGFVPTKDCPGRNPLGVSSACQDRCMGPKGIEKTPGITPPCVKSLHIRLGL